MYPFEQCAPFYATGSSLVKATNGFLHTIVIGNVSSGSGVLSAYDGLDGSGQPFVSIPMATTTVPTTLIFDTYFGKGLYIAFTAFTGSVTVNYR